MVDVTDSVEFWYRIFTNGHQKRILRDGFFGLERADESSEYGSNNINNSSVSKVFGESIQERIRLALDKVSSDHGPFFFANHVAQFWAPKVIGERCYLTTLDQPFSVGRPLDKGSGRYRRECMNHYYIIDNDAKEEEVGPPGRVFRSGHPESSTDLRLYSVKEFPLRDQAALSGFSVYYALPLFDLCGQNQCIGVLEIVSSNICNFWVHEFPHYHKAIKEAQLRLLTHDFLSDINILTKDTKYMTEPQLEIRDMLELAIHVLPQLNLVQVWAPCNTCTNSSNHLNCMERLAFKTAEFDYNFTMQRFLDAGRLHNLQVGKGIAGIALSSTNKLCFCGNLSSISIIQYPLAHYARKAMFDICFAICLQSSHTDNTLYVLEFFLRSGIVQGGYHHSLYSLLQIMKHKLKSFKVASGQELGEELVVDVIESGKEKKLSESTYTDIFPIRFNIIQSSQEMEHEHSRNKQVHSDHNDMNISEAEQSDVAATTANKEVITSKTKRSRKETSFHLDLGDLEPHFGKRLEDVARELGVGKSTVKRVCRKFGIERWPGNEKNKKNPSLFLKENAVNQVQLGDAETSISSGTNIPPSDLTIHQNKPHSNTESTQQLAKICPETDMMMVKAKFKDDTIKFQFGVSSGLEKLKEEVNKRLNLKIGSFKLKYLDEGDGDWILLGCEDDLQLCVKTLTALGKTCIQVLVQLITP